MCSYCNYYSKSIFLNYFIMKHYIEKIYIIISLLSIFFIHAQTHSYIEMHRNTAEQLSSEYGIPSAVILAIAFVETG